MKIKTEMSPLSNGGKYPSCGSRADLDHDAAAAHALLQAYKEARKTHSYDFFMDILARADELLSEWGFAE